MSCLVSRPTFCSVTTKQGSSNPFQYNSHTKNIQEQIPAKFYIQHYLNLSAFHLIIKYNKTSYTQKRKGNTEKINPFLQYTYGYKSRML